MYAVHKQCLCLFSASSPFRDSSDKFGCLFVFSSLFVRQVSAFLVITHSHKFWRLLWIFPADFSVILFYAECPTDFGVCVPLFSPPSSLFLWLFRRVPAFISHWSSDTFLHLLWPFRQIAFFLRGFPHEFRCYSHLHVLAFTMFVFFFDKVSACCPLFSGFFRQIWHFPALLLPRLSDNFRRYVFSLALSSFEAFPTNLGVFSSVAVFRRHGRLL